MARVRQFYSGDGVPMAVPAEPEHVVTAWSSHRQRFRSWFAALDADQWLAPTRCSEWQVKDIAQHLISGAQFLGYTLHQARKGEATHLLNNFDAQVTARTATALFDGMGLAELLEQLSDTDQRVEREIRGFTGELWNAPAEAPPGQVAAYVAVNHFLFDSYVHERDVMLPLGEIPVTEPEEASAVASYVMALAGLALGHDYLPFGDRTLRLDLTDIGRHLCVAVVGDWVQVDFCDPSEAVNISATTGALVDVATGRAAADVLDADAAGADYLTHLAKVMA